MPERGYCTARSRQAGEDPVGTASRARRWVLVEQPGAWGSDVLHNSDLPAEVAAHLRHLRDTLPARVLLIRRPAGGRVTAPSVYAGVTPPGGGGWLERLHLDEVEDLLNLDLTPLRQGGSVGGERIREPVYLVCTNGSHDPCCAEYGLPVVRALSALVEDRLWECSHMGGDRFAGNLVVLPRGHFYGHLDPTTALAVVHGVEQGRMDLSHWRGDCALPFPVQAAEAHLRRHLDLTDPAVTVRPVARWRDGRRHEVRFEVSDGRVAEVVVVDGDRLEARPLTCAGDPGRAPAWQLVDIAVTGG